MDPAFADVARGNLGRLFHLCRRMTLDDAAAAAATFDALARASVEPLPPVEDRTRWLLRRAAQAIVDRLPPSQDVTFDSLDETLRSESTRTGEMSRLPSPERDLLLWDLKQGCMTAVVNCLPPGERIAFVLGSVLGVSEEEGARVLGIKPSAFRVRLSRARQKIDDYLAPRCEHIDPRNPCHCPSRIGVALRKGFIAPPDFSSVSLRKPPAFATERSSDATAIFRTLPEPDAPPALVARVERALSTGRWT